MVAPWEWDQGSRSCTTTVRPRSPARAQCSLSSLGSEQRACRRRRRAGPAWRQVRQAATIARAAWHIGLTTYVPIVSHAGPRHLSKLSPGFHSSIGRQMNAAQMRTNSRHRSGDHSHWPLTEATTNGSAKGLWWKKRLVLKTICYQTSFEVRTMWRQMNTAGATGVDHLEPAKLPFLPSVGSRR